MNRMVKQTKQPEVLHELFAALGNDPFVIAECLARPVLTERLVGDLQRRTTKGARVRQQQKICEACRRHDCANGAYTLPRIAEGILHAQTIAGHPPASPTRPPAEATTAQSGRH